MRVDGASPARVVKRANLLPLGGHDGVELLLSIRVPAPVEPVPFEIRRRIETTPRDRVRVELTTATRPASPSVRGSSARQVSSARVTAPPMEIYTRARNV